MTAVLGAAVGVLWSVTLLARHALVVLVLPAIPAAQRVIAAFHLAYGLVRPAFLPA